MSTPEHTSASSLFGAVSSVVRGLAAGAVCALALIAGALLAIGLTGGLARSQDLPAVGIDPDTAGNSALSIGRLDSCYSVASDSTFSVDLYVQDVEELLAWEIYITYDLERLELLERDVRLFQAANSGSDVIDVSAALPAQRPPYRVAAADISDPATPDSGSGVLARLTFRALSPGLTEIEITYLDLDDDGAPDVGPFLRNVAGDPIGDTDGDTYFDGQARSAQVAVDASCENADPPLETGDGSSTSISPVVWIAAGVGGAVVVLLGAVMVINRRSRAAEGP